MNLHTLFYTAVEVPFTYEGEIPDGFDIIDLEAEQIMIFQGPKYDDEIFEEAITDMIQAIKEYDPTLYGFKWNEHSARFQLEPQGYRGYIEGIPVVQLNK